MKILARFAAAAVSLASFSLPTLRAADPTLDAGFVSTISPGLTPTSYPIFAPGAPVGAVNALALQSDGKILAGGNISRYQTSGDLTALKRLLATGALDTAFNSGGAGLANGAGQPEVKVLFTDSADRIYVGGTFTSYNDVPRSGILRLLADGTLDASYAPAGLAGTSRYAQTLALQPDGKLLVGGAFSSINGTARQNLARLLPTGVIDPDFTPAISSSEIKAIAVQPDGKIIVAGNSSGRHLLARLYSDGSLDASFVPALAPASSTVDQALLLPDGRLIISGFLTLPSGVSADIVALRTDGSLDTTFQTNIGEGPNGYIGYALRLQPDGTILAAGVFNSWNGQPRASVASLNPDGTLRDDFAPLPYSDDRGQYGTHFYSLAVQPDGKLLAGGLFSRVTDPAVETYNLTRFVNEFAPSSPGALRLFSATSTTAENAGSVTLQVSRFGGTSGAVSVQFATSTGGANGTATAGADFTTATGTLSWAAGEGGFKTITITLPQDTAAESAESFTVTLSAPTGGATIPASHVKTRVTIRDDDSAPAITRTPVPITTEQGSRVTFSVRYDSVLPATVKWQRDPDGLGVGAGFTDIPGATGLDYVIPVSDPALHNGHYRAVVTSPSGSASSDAAELFVAVPAGSVINTFTPSEDIGAINAAVPDSLGRILALTSTSLRRLGPTGSFEPTTTFGITFAANTATSVLPLADGRILVGGSFTGQTHQPGSTSTAISRLVRLNADATGTIDTAFSATLNGPVTTLAPGGAGKFYVGVSGASTSANGVQRFLATGLPDTTFAPPANTVATGLSAYVYAIKEQTDGKVLVAYVNGSPGSITRRIARLTSAGSLDFSFGAGGILIVPNNAVGLDLLPDGRIAVAGSFATLAGASQQYVGLLLPDGTPDPDFVFTGVLDNSTTGVLYRDGRLLVWGPFTTVNGASQGNLVRLNLDGSVDTTFSVGAGASGSFGYAIRSAFYNTQDDLVIAGSFTAFKGVARNRVALLVANPLIGVIGFAPSRQSEVERAATATFTLRRYGLATEAVSIRYSTADGTALAGTDYTAATGTVSWAAGDTTDKTLAITLLDDSAIEPSETFRILLSDPTGPATPAASATVTLLDSDTFATFTAQPSATQPNLSIGGALVLNVSVSSPTPATYQWFLNGVALPGITGLGYVQTPVTLHDAGIYTLVVTNAAGSVTSQPVHVVISPQPGRPFSGQPTTGRPQFDNFGGPSTMVALPDGGALLGGGFLATTALNRPLNYLLRIRPNGTTDPTFNLVLNSAVVALRIQPDGKVLVFGNFTTANSVAQRYLVRLNADLTLDTDFNTAAATALNTTAIPNSYSALNLALDSTGRIYLSFSSGGGILRRVNADGTLDASYLVASSSNGSFALAVDSSDRLLVGGAYTNIGPVATIGSAPTTSPARPRLARLSADGTVDQTFLPSVASLSFRDLAVHPATGRIYAGLDNTPGIIEILADGSPTVTNIGSNDSVSELALSPDGRPTIVRGNGVIGSARVQRFIPGATPGATATADTAYSTGTGTNGNIVTTLAYRPDGSLWIAGDFTTVNGVTTAGVALLQPGLGDPGIVNPPVRQDANPGSTVRLSVGATGTGLTYQWLKAGLPLVADARITGVTTPVLTIAGLTLADDALYSVVVTSTAAPASPLASIAVKVNVLGAPTVAASPASITPALGATFGLAGDVLAAAPATYVWRRDGVLIVNGGRYSGATTGKLVVTGANNADNGSYVLTVTNALGTASTIPATVTVAQIAHQRDLSTSALTSSSPGNTGNYVNAFLPLPDGRTLVAGPGGFRGTNTFNVNAHLAVADSAANFSELPAGAFNGEVRVLRLLADGKILVAGNFTQIGATARSRIARLNADLTLDTAFAPVGAGNAITLLAVDTTGRIYLYGSFFNYGGLTGYSNFVRLLPDGSLDLDYKVSFTGSIDALIPLNDGKLLVAGGFASHTVNNTTTTNISRLGRLMPDGTVDSTFTSAFPNNQAINSLAVDSVGRIVVGANSYNSQLGQAFYHLVRFLPNGGADASFAFPETINGEIKTLAVVPGDKVLVGGAFTTPTNRLFRVNADGTRDTTFDVGTGFTHTIGSPFVSTLATDTLGRIWVGGTRFTSYNGVTANALAVLQGEGTVLAFTAQPAGQTRDLGATATFTASATGNNGFTFRWRKNGVPLSDGPRISGATTPTLAIANLVSADEAAYSVVVTSPSASITSASASLTVLGAPVITADPASLARDLGSTATLTASVRGAATLAYQWLHFGNTLSDGTAAGVTVSGATTSVLTITGLTFAQAGEYRLRVTNSNGTALSAPATLTVESRPGALAKDLPAIGADGPVLAILRLNDGSMLVGGQFSNIAINGALQPRVRIARFLADGTLDPNFNPVFSGAVRALAQDTAGRVFVGGDFTQVTFGGTATPRIRVARLTSALALDPAFDTSASGPTGVNAAAQIVYTLAPVGDGSVFVGGSFTAIGAATHTVGAVTAGVNRVARFNASGAHDTSFVSYADGHVRALLRLPDGSLFIAGESTTWNSPGVTGNPNARIVKLSATGTRLTFATLPAVSGFSFPTVHRLVLLADGSLLVSGGDPIFSTPVLTRLNSATGAPITDYVTTLAAATPTPFSHNSTVAGLAQQTDGKILSGSAGRLFRTTVAGAADADTLGANRFALFEPGAINAIALDGSGRIWVGGTFVNYDSRSQDRIAVLAGGEVESRDGLLLPQTLTFSDIADRTFGQGGATVPLAATSDRSLAPITFSITSSTPANIATISGNTLTITGAGSIIVEAAQAGNATYRPATATQTFTVAKASQTISSFAPLADRTITAPDFVLSATASSGLPVAFGVTGVATLGSDGKTVTLTGATGTVTVTATQPGNANYNPAAPGLVQTFEVTAGTPQTITFADPADRLVTAAPFDLNASATSGLAVSFSLTSSPPGIATLVGKRVTLLGVGTVTITATQPGGDRAGVTYAAAPAVEQSFISLPVPPKPQTITFVQPAARTFGSAPAPLAATAASKLPVTFEIVSSTPAAIASIGPDGKTLTLLGAGTVTLRATQPGGPGFSSAPSIERTLVVNKAPQTLAYTVPAKLPLSTTPLILSGTATPSGLPVSFTVVSGAATLEGASLTFTGTGPVKLRATQAGNENYLAAKPLEKTITITSTAVLTLGDLTTTYDGEDHEVTVTGVPPGFEDELVVTYKGSRNLPRNAGTYPVIASLGTLRKTGNLVINKAPLLLFGVDVFRVVGAADPAFTLRYEGFKGTDASAPITSIVTTAPRISTSAKTNSNAGVYPFVFTGGTSPNYTLKAAPIPGALTVKGFGGTYEAILVDGDLMPVGKLSLTIPPNALSFSGTLTTAREAKTVSFKSVATKLFISTPDATSASLTDLLVTVGGTAYNLDLTVNALGGMTGDFNADGVALTGTLAHGARVNVFPKGATVPGVGANTLALHPAYVLFDEDQGPIPGGSGHATAAIAAGTGVLTVKGFVADGLPLTASLKPTQGDAYLLYANPYGARTGSFIAGRLALQDHPDQTRFNGRSYIPFEDGLLIWQKAPLPDTTLPAKQDKSYRAGFGPLGIQVSLDPWIAPATKPTTKAPIIPAGTLAQRLGLTDSAITSATLNISHGPESLDFGDSEDALPFQGMLSAAGALTAGNAAATSWTIKITPTTGAFSGSFKLVDAVFVIPKPPSHDTLKFVPRTVTFSGTLRQTPDGDAILGTGFFLLPPVPVTPAPVPALEQPSGEIRFTAPAPAP